MFVHLAKRIAMPGETAVTKCGWNAVDGYVSAGCADGLVKVLKLEIPESKSKLFIFEANCSFSWRCSHTWRCRSSSADQKSNVRRSFK